MVEFGTVIFWFLIALSVGFIYPNLRVEYDGAVIKGFLRRHCECFQSPNWIFKKHQYIAKSVDASYFTVYVYSECKYCHEKVGERVKRGDDLLFFIKSLNLGSEQITLVKLLKEGEYKNRQEIQRIINNSLKNTELEF